MKKSFIYACALFGLVFSLYQPSIASADEANQDMAGHHHHHHHHHHHGHHKFVKKVFRLGVCVGQTLAQEGIIFPAPVAGQKPKLDDATKKALKAAVKSCRAAAKVAEGDQTSSNESEAAEGADSEQALD